MMEIKIKISDIDYAAAIDILAPALADKLSGCSNPVAAFALGRARDLSVTAAKSASQKYYGRICRRLSQPLRQRNLPLDRGYGCPAKPFPQGAGPRGRDDELSPAVIPAHSNILPRIKEELQCPAI